MFFFVQYDRSTGDIVTLQEFSGTQRLQAEDIRLKIELDINQRGLNHEVVLLEADSQDALRRTHQRYFVGVSRMLSDWSKVQEELHRSRHRSAGD